MHLALPVLAILPAGLLVFVLHRLYPANPASSMTNAADSHLKQPSYSLWLSPAADAPATPTFKALNRSLPGPHFPAHATLLGCAPKGATVDEIVRGIKAALGDWRKDGGEARVEGAGLEVELEDVRKGEEFFRCVLVKLCDDPALHSLHERVLAHLPSPSERPTFFPHVSLVYSDMSSTERQAIVDELYASGQARAVEGGGVELRAQAGGAPEEKATTARFDRVVVVVTKDVPPEDWVPVAEVVV